jgi:6-pyruvoyltetrahydropterin/6-carboxytetrahydropterin synthase
VRARLQRHYGFEAAHFLPKVPAGHKCARVHGHSYSVDVSIEGNIDETSGWVMDFAEIDEAVSPLIRQLDHQLLNEMDGLANPTSEVLAIWLWTRIKERLPLLVEVEVSETKNSRCVFRGE